MLGANYVVAIFGRWLSMDPKNTFHKKLIGTGGHANYVSRSATRTAHYPHRAPSLVALLILRTV